MSTTRATEADKAVALIRQAIETVEHLHRTPPECVTTNGIVTVLNDVVRRIEGLLEDAGD